MAWLIVASWLLAGFVGYWLVWLNFNTISGCRPIKVSTLLGCASMSLLGPLLLFVGALFWFFELASLIYAKVNLSRFNVVVWNPCEWWESRKPPSDDDDLESLVEKLVSSQERYHDGL